MTNAIQDVRSFNRFYTRKIGLLGRTFLKTDFSLPEARVLFELANGRAATAADLVRGLGMDKAHVSRILARFAARGLVESRASPEHARRQLLDLTPAGRAAFAELDLRMETEVARMLAPLGDEDELSLSSSLATVERLLGPATRQPGSEVVLRAPQSGDLGQVASRQAILFKREHGFDWSMEGLVFEILARFVSGFDPAKERAWIAEIDGEIVGSVFLMRADEHDTAKLRLLYVEPCARGRGVGAKLVSACVAQARDFGYRRLTLWTNDVLASARRLYEAAGFVLVSEERHRSFGRDLNGQIWALDLDAG